MKKLLLLLALFGASSALAADTYLGLTAGYLTDSQEGYYATDFGYTFAKSEGITHSAELEIGYTSDHDSGLKGEILPVMANYRGVVPINQSPFGVYFGAGLGTSRVKISGWVDDSAWAFTYQLLAGVEFKASDSVSLRLGARYIDVDNVKILGYTVDIGNDTSLEAGVNFKF